MDVDAIARGWIDYWDQHERTGIFPDSDLGSFVFNLDADSAWAVILKILEMTDPDPNEMPFQVLAAGPTEDFIVQHGRAVIDRIEAEAQRNPRLKLLLGGVWKRDIPDDVWARVERSREHSW